MRKQTIEDLKYGNGKQNIHLRSGTGMHKWPTQIKASNKTPLQAVKCRNNPTQDEGCHIGNLPLGGLSITEVKIIVNLSPFTFILSYKNARLQQDNQSCLSVLRRLVYCKYKASETLQR